MIGTLLVTLVGWMRTISISLNIKHLSFSKWHLPSLNWLDWGFAHRYLGPLLVCLRERGDMHFFLHTRINRLSLLFRFTTLIYFNTTYIPFPWKASNTNQIALHSIELFSHCQYISFGVEITFVPEDRYTLSYIPNLLPNDYASIHSFRGTFNGSSLLPYTWKTFASLTIENPVTGYCLFGCQLLMYI